MKKEIKAVICIVLSVWFFFMGFEIGSYHEKKNLASTLVTNTITPATQNNVTSSTAPSTTESTTASTAPSVSDTTDSSNAPSQSPESSTTKKSGSDPSSMTKAQVLAEIKKAVDGVKAEQNMTAVQDEKISINVDDCSVPSALSTVNSIVSGLTESDGPVTYSFVNGQAVGVTADGKSVDDGATVSPTQVIPPKNQNFDLTEAGVVDFSAKKDGENTVYMVKLAEENTTLDSPFPAHNAAAIGYLDIASLSIPTVTITAANMHYPGSTVTATVNKDGKLVKLELYLPMDGYGEAKIFVASGNAAFSGNQTEVWTFTY